MNKKAFSWALLFLVIVAISIFGIFYVPLDKELTITDNKGNEVDFLIKIVKCSEIQDVDSTFLVPGKYSDSERFYSEQINETHGKMCWYDAFKKESINSTWLDENCEINKKYWSCDKGFNVR